MSAGTFAGVAGAAAGDRADEIRFITHNFTTITIDPTAGNARFTLETNGNVSFRADEGPVPAVNADEWHRDNPVVGLGNDWEVKATLTANTAPDSGNLNVWEALTSARAWQNNTGAVSVVKASTFTLEFRLAGTTTVLKTITGMFIGAVMDP